MLLQALGWSINDSKNQEGVRVRFLGYILDSSVKQFQVPEDKLERTKSLVSNLLDFLDRTNTLPVKNLESTLGSILSMRLAIPLVSVFTRDLYSPWKTHDFFITPGMTVTATPQMRDELVMLGQLLSSSNGAPFMNASSEIDLFVDSSEIGWGASALGQTARALSERYHWKILHLQRAEWSSPSNLEPADATSTEQQIRSFHHGLQTGHRQPGPRRRAGRRPLCSGQAIVGGLLI
jgi:hypothetical protein